MYRYLIAGLVGLSLQGCYRIESKSNDIIQNVFPDPEPVVFPVSDRIEYNPMLKQDSRMTAEEFMQGSTANTYTDGALSIGHDEITVLLDHSDVYYGTLFYEFDDPETVALLRSKVFELVEAQNLVDKNDMYTLNNHGDLRLQFDNYEFFVTKVLIR